MCHVLFMASAHIRPEIPWSNSEPAFFVTADDSAAEEVRRQFTKPNVYYLGSDEGCGCGFIHEERWQYTYTDDLDARLENQRRLANYLTTCLADEEYVELFSCWSGDEAAEPVRRRQVLVSELLNEEFHFIEREHIAVRK
jgi:hypothetical protein